MVPAIPRGSVRDYLACFADVTAIIVTDGRASATRDLSRVKVASSCLWATGEAARKIARHANRHGTSIEAAAAALSLPVTQHDAMLERVGHAVARVDAALAHAKSAGALRFFNRAYRARRQAGSCPPYRTAYAMLRRALFRKIASGMQHMPNLGDASILAEIFAATPRRPRNDAARGREGGAMP
jgi:hypothetical protein